MDHPFTDPCSEAPPALADRFRFEACLGSGESGTVYRATTKRPLHGLDTGSVVAVKLLHPGLLRDPAARARLRREGQLGRRIDSPHVVSIHGVDEVATTDGPLVYLASEYVEGRTLRELSMERGAAVGDLVRRIGEQASLGLAALHEAGIVHRDIKPENLLITDDESTVKVMDLGLAKVGAPDDPQGPSSGGFHGSLAYASPETLRGRPATTASDLYTLGVVLFELLTGQHPYQDVSATDAMLHAHLHTAAPRASHLDPRVPPFLDELVAELLRKDPSERPASATTLAEILAQSTASTWWRGHVKAAPVLASRRRLGAIRRSSHAPFVNRRAAIRSLDRLALSAAEGRGTAVEVIGPIGSGRRRLLDECIERWLEEIEGTVFFGGQADRDPSRMLTSPFPQIVLDAYLPGERPGSPRALERLAERVHAECGFDSTDARRLAEICTDAPTARALPPAARADLLFRALVQQVRDHAMTVLRIDRVEELSRSARMIVDRLITESRSSPLLCLFVGTRARLGPGTTVISVGSLRMPAFVELGERLFRDRRAPTALVEGAHLVLSGLPGALTESLEDLVEQGLLDGRPGDFHDLSPAVTELAPARPALARLRQRLVGLPRAERHVLQAAAVLGPRFRVADVAELTGRPELDVLERLGTHDDRVVATDGGIGRFRHRGYRRTVLDAIEPGVIRQLHRTAAWVLEDRGAPPLEVGLHLSRALEHSACVEPLLDGLEGLVEAHSRRQAQRIVERLRLHLADLPATPERDAQRVRWHLLAGQTWTLVDAENKAVDAFRQANLLADALGRPVDKARALVGIANLSQLRGRFLSTVQLLAGAEQLLLQPTGDEARATAAHAKLIHGRVLAYRGQTIGALRLVREGLALAPGDDHGLLAHLWVDLARWQTLRMRFVRALDSLDRAAAEVSLTDDVIAGIRVHLHRGRILGLLGDLDAASSELGEAHELASRYESDRLRGRARLFHGELLAWIGSHAAAAPLLVEAREALRRSGDRVGFGLADLLLRLGRRQPVTDAPIEVHHVPILDLTALLVGAAERRAAGDSDGARALLHDAFALDRSARVNLLPRLALLRAAHRDQTADRLIERLSARLPSAAMRRRFVAFADRIRL